jgi:hypothetical protein
MLCNLARMTSFQSCTKRADRFARMMENAQRKIHSCKARTMELFPFVRFPRKRAEQALEATTPSHAPFLMIMILARCGGFM